MRNIMKRESGKSFYGKWYWIFHRGNEHILFSMDQNKFGEFFHVSYSCEKVKHYMCFTTENSSFRWIPFVSGFIGIFLQKKVSSSQAEPQSDVAQPEVENVSPMQIESQPVHQVVEKVESHYTITNSLSQESWNQAIIIETYIEISSWNYVDLEIAKRFGMDIALTFSFLQLRKLFFFASLDNKKILLNNGHWDYDGVFIRLMPWWNGQQTLLLYPLSLQILGWRLKVFLLIFGEIIFFEN